MGRSRQAHRLGWIVFATLALFACEAGATDNKVALLCSGTATDEVLGLSAPPITIPDKTIIIDFGQRKVTSFLGEFPIINDSEYAIDFDGKRRAYPEWEEVIGSINRLSGTVGAQVVTAGVKWR
jgi:hypothetical protein